MDMYFEPENYGRLDKNYRNKIKTLKEWIWGQDVSSNDIEKWVQNFRGEFDGDRGREQINALHLLSQFMYFTQKEIRLLLVSVYRDLYYKPLIQDIRKHFPEISSEELSDKIKEKIKVTRFLGIGNSSESSCLLLYYFRQVNELSTDIFIDNCDIYEYTAEGSISGLKTNKDGQDIEYYIFLDDISGTGTQAKSHFEKINYKHILDLNPNAKILYFTLLRTSTSYELFNTELREIKFKTIFELDDTYKCYGSESRHFVGKNASDAHTQEKEYSKNVCKKYMIPKVESYEICGFKNSQLLLGFFYNTPNNTLPIFWFEDTSWSPVFKRYSKEIGGV